MIGLEIAEVVGEAEIRVDHACLEERVNDGKNKKHQQDTAPESQGLLEDPGHGQVNAVSR